MHIGGSEPSPKPVTRWPLANSGGLAPFEIASQDPAWVRKADGRGMELRICSRVSNARWESPKMHFLLLSQAGHRPWRVRPSGPLSVAEPGPRLPGSCESRSPRGPFG